MTKLQKAITKTLQMKMHKKFCYKISSYKKKKNTKMI